MRGFDTEFKNLDQYIRVITDRIWKDRRIDDIRSYYSDPCVVETSSSVSTSVQEVVQNTQATMAEFPGRHLLTEDVIQSGDDDSGYLSSHRIVSTMTHQVANSFGAPSGRAIHVRTIADCVCKNNRVIHEWLVRDEAAIAICVGIQPRVLAQTWLNQSGGWNKKKAGPVPDGYRSHLSDAPAAQAYAGQIEQLAHQKNTGLHAYDEAVHHIGPGNVTFYGQREVHGFWQNLFGSLHVTRFDVEHLTYQTGAGRADRVALRWRAQALHTNSGASAGRYGPATGRIVEVMGINHAELVDAKVVREWVLIDDVALWMQVLAVQN